MTTTHPTVPPAGAAPEVTPEDVRAAAERIRPDVRHTPLLGVELDDRPLLLKLEHLQVTGSFKVRGATNAIRSAEPSPHRIIAASGGNHGLGVAHAARVAGIQATVVVPETVEAEKARRITAAGATVIRHGDGYAAAEARALELAESQAARFVHAFADPLVIAGQGTVGLEVLADAPPGGQPDVLIVAVGGGGLIGGIGVACSGTGTRVVGVEPTGIPTLHDALAAGAPVDVPVASVTASALGARRTHVRNLALATRHVSEVVLVDDDAILEARDVLWETCRLAVEPAAAAPLAALRAGLVHAERPCLVLCGANSAWSPS